MSVCCECCVLLGRVLCDGTNSATGVLPCVCVCDCECVCVCVCALCLCMFMRVRVCVSV
jgi:hypothetical protein